MNELISMMKAIAPRCSDELCEAILKRLESLGYTTTDTDIWLLCFAIEKVENHIKNFCNIISIPEGLFNVEVDKVCGEFLFTKKQSGQLQIETLNLTGAVKSISEGDTSISFADGMSDEDKFNQLLDNMMNKGEGELLCYRSIKW